MQTVEKKCAQCGDSLRELHLSNQGKEFCNIHCLRQDAAANAKDTEGNPLQPGALYAERYIDYYGKGIHTYGRLLWFGGDGCYYDSDNEGDGETTPHGDDLVKQINPINVEYAELKPLGRI